MPPTTASDYQQLAAQIKHWGLELGFQQIGVSDIDLSIAEGHLQHWLELERHGEMHYMAAHGLKRSRPAILQAGTGSIISARMDYLPEVPANSQKLCVLT